MKTVILGITGGIAAYKAAELARLFVRSGEEVQVVMTPSAQRFITPLTLQTITGRQVFTDLFAPLSGERVRHVELAEEARVLVVAPATANTLAKMAAGIADNLLTTLFLAVRCPVVLVPSMNENMYEHPAVQENLERLRARGCRIMTPDCGRLACGVIGRGRMPEPAEIFNYVRAVLSPKDFAGVRALVTAGPTREHLDPVRFISNASTGRMGFAVARALQERGAEVILVTGPTELKPPPGVAVVAVETAEQMYRAVLEHYSRCRLVVKTAAVADYRPADAAPQKLKKKESSLSLELVANPDILKELGRQKGDRVLVGFAVETEAPVEHARLKLKEKNLDLIVVNNPSTPGCGFAVETNQVKLINRQGEMEELPLMGKEELAHRLLDRVAPLLRPEEGEASSKESE
ncbi:MAG TPA: bifunctional phosphopantothenoylcysteine decarboxylase/phosphopantothenate--cysteine ligase CoaBC [Bacillota bacterium]|nr:bifunctional phosphopantothenoylcysteine decarboxylase/phosphopantothenate--cysteine ligase CoaBC [Bacillota bacterium]HOP68848.1 bifunctional phosphopantothenoylcysteine decarboxylase/phosphopantothenate--cysteine ligase CoaBC [Bacillota bacterium]HPT33822.1 bifunctional phosphopantothenoylcysteine decarboxylase/phosphopantothenate--cysteine ligase CoaBC [Bacillota bacterium]HPZ64721.1 bifunctional phosphopantothenoylcysteine decarboxylase/phosphopantothenate--cysteine ligase CoaBC [Bacillot